MSGIKLGAHFALDEFRCKDGSAFPENFAETIKDTIEFLERLRLLMNFKLLEKTGKWSDTGIFVVSGYRSAAYNRRVGGASASRHVAGQAADVKPVRGYDKIFSYADFLKLAEYVDESFTDRPYRLGAYPHLGAGAWVHVDCAYGFGGRRW